MYCLLFILFLLLTLSFALISSSKKLYFFQVYPKHPSTQIYIKSVDRLSKWSDYNWIKSVFDSFDLNYIR